MGKKNKRTIAGKKERARRKRRAKLKKRRIRAQGRPPGNVVLNPAPPFSEIAAPEGFRPISISQALMTYADPIMAFFDNSSMGQINSAMKLAMGLWNYEITEKEGRENLEKTRDGIIREIKAALDMGDKEAAGFFDKMVERKTYLFPSDVQPEYPNIMFIRKEIRHVLPEFDHGKITFPKEPVPPDREDENLVEALRLLDQYIADGTDYGDWEDHYMNTEEQCRKRFRKWLEDKGLDEYGGIFPFCVETYLNFIYRYAHEDAVCLKTVSQACIDEFFSDHLLRKCMARPDEYVNWPPAIKSFHVFLQEKGYLEDPMPVIKAVDGIEPRFMEVLRKMF